ncbi:MAG TPA: MTAP family purine nucleoside phosphorylase [Syntrophales bacterium]|nr:MTAP family purine nucleoside phosphorylase [Syntrophales bacterium]
MRKTAIISGTIPISLKGERKNILTPFGEVTLIMAEKCIFLPRHGLDPIRYILPHRINHPAHFSALKITGVERVIALNSSGSLKREIPPGTLVVPHDFIFWGPNPTVFLDECRHITPKLSEDLRRLLIQAARACGGEVKERGIYWQTWGPRFETRAEISLMSQWADIVGMTMASEATCAAELDLPYAAICSVDNYAHGIVEKPLSMEEVTMGARRQAALLEEIVKYVIGA